MNVKHNGGVAPGQAHERISALGWRLTNKKRPRSNR